MTLTYIFFLNLPGCSFKSYHLFSHEAQGQNVPNSFTVAMSFHCSMLIIVRAAHKQWQVTIQILINKSQKARIAHTPLSLRITYSKHQLFTIFFLGICLILWHLPLFTYQCHQCKTLPFSSFFSLWMTTCLVRVVPLGSSMFVTMSTCLTGILIRTFPTYNFCLRWSFILFLL